MDTFSAQTGMMKLNVYTCEKLLSPEPSSVDALCASIASNSSSQHEREDSVNSLCTTLDDYLQEPVLLDPVLPIIVETLLPCISVHYLRSLHKNDQRDLNITLAPVRVLYVAIKVRGAKPFARYFPHELQHFNTALNLLLYAQKNLTDNALWQLRYILYQWMATAILIPFPLSTVTYMNNIDQAMDGAITALAETAKTSSAAAVFLARLVTRRDCTDLLNRFMPWCCDAVTTEKHAASRHAALLTATNIFKIGRRDQLQSYVKSFLKPVTDLAEQANSISDAHMATKLSQRLALAYLPPRVCSWRYSRGARVLFGQTRRIDLWTNRTGRPLGTGLPTQGQPEESTNEVELSSSTADDEESGAWNLDDTGQAVLESILDILLRSLQHRDTVVRWSAAKGVGRITSRLPLESAQDVVASVLQLFTSDTAARADASYHGGCLAVAELLRHGLILPDGAHFAEVFDVITRAAAFDVRRGANSVGAHVRDAACYVVWALARAYSPDDVARYASFITNSMLPIALLDREVHCRRAAAAALQECVGRLSSRVIPDGIKLITLADFFSLGERTMSFLNVAVEVGAIADGIYLPRIIQELSESKLLNWDASVRSLAARALAAQVPNDKKGVLATTVLPRLISMAMER